jgi:hypothetical protein
LDGKTVYVIGFSDGTLVYVDTTGHIVAIQLPSSGGSDDSEEEHEQEMDDD